MSLIRCLALLLLFPLFATIAEARSKAKPLSPGDLMKEIERIGEEANVANGSYEIAEYKAPAAGQKIDPTTIAEVGKKIRESMESGFSGDCVYEEQKGGRNIQLANIRGSEEDPATAAALRKLWSRGHLLKVVSYSWDSSSGDSEYCSAASYAFFFSNGKILHLDYDHTD